jgi:5-(aminomethyl)-3-furanmethanol phosphate kinase
MTAGWRRGVIRGGEGTAVPKTVIKFGGSLLVRVSWPDELRTLLAGFAGPTTIVVGGGAVVEGLRAIDAASPRPADVMHQLAIEAMGVTARLVAAAAGLPLAAAPALADRAVVLDAAAWLSHVDRHGELPVGWHVTSDSIAAVVAAASDATLVLAKSVPPPASAGDLASLARAGWVDDHFPIAAATLDWIEWAAPSGIIPTSSR